MKLESRTHEASVGVAKIALPTGLGTLCVSVAGDPGLYDEFEVDLVRGDYMRQVAVIGVEEPDAATTGDLHAYVWDNPVSDDAETKISLDPTDEETALSRCWYRVPRRDVSEDKAGFVETLALALAANESDRYGDLASDGPRYVASKDGEFEYVTYGGRAVNVTGDSLTAIGRAVMGIVDGTAETMPASVARDTIDKADARKEDAR